jgi:hypothetical protein
MHSTKQSLQALRQQKLRNISTSLFTLHPDGAPQHEEEDTKAKKD